MALEYSSTIQIEKMKQLTIAYNELKQDLDDRLQAIVSKFDDPKDRESWYNIWRFTHNAMRSDYNRKMEEIQKGEI